MTSFDRCAAKLDADVEAQIAMGIPSSLGLEKCRFADMWLPDWVHNMPMAHDYSAWTTNSGDDHFFSYCAGRKALGIRIIKEPCFSWDTHFDGRMTGCTHTRVASVHNLKSAREMREAFGRFSVHCRIRSDAVEGAKLVCRNVTGPKCQSSFFLQ